MILIIFSWDGFIQWYEAVCLVALYLIYVGTMFFNEKLMTALGELGENFAKK